MAPGPRPGKVMYVEGGRHKGLTCRVVELLPQKENRSSEWHLWKRDAARTGKTRKAVVRGWKWTGLVEGNELG